MKLLSVTNLIPPFEFSGKMPGRVEYTIPESRHEFTIQASRHEYRLPPSMLDFSQGKP